MARTPNRNRSSPQKDSTTIPEEDAVSEAQIKKDFEDDLNGPSNNPTIPLCLATRLETLNVGSTTITDLPSELLLSIFTYVIDDEKDQIPFHGFLGQWGSVNGNGLGCIKDISLVCRRFRDVLDIIRFADCHANFKVDSPSRYYLHSKPADTIIEKYETYRNKGSLVRKFTVCSKDGDLCEYYPEAPPTTIRTYTDIPLLFVLLLPSFTRLVTLSLSRTFPLPLVHFAEGLRMALMICQSLEVLKLEVHELVEEDKDCFQHMNTLCPEFETMKKSYPALRELHLSFRHKSTSRSGSSSFLWFMEIFPKILGPSASMVKHLALQYYDYRLRGEPETFYGHEFEHWFYSDTWQFPALESLDIDLGKTTIWVLNNLIEFEHKAIKRIRLQHLNRSLWMNDNLRAQDFLTRLPNLHVVDITFPARKDWVNFFLYSQQTHYNYLEEITVDIPFDWDMVYQSGSGGYDYTCKQANGQHILRFPAG